MPLGSIPSTEKKKENPKKPGLEEADLSLLEDPTPASLSLLDVCSSHSEMLVESPNPLQGP